METARGGERGTILATLLVLAATAGPGAGQETAVQGTEFGEPIQGIGGVEFELFRLGLEDFLEVEDADEGLGPLYNGRSCAECHVIPAIGGTSTITEVRAGTLHPDGTFQGPAGRVPDPSLLHPQPCDPGRGPRGRQRGGQAAADPPVRRRSGGIGSG